MCFGMFKSRLPGSISGRMTTRTPSVDPTGARQALAQILLTAGQCGLTSVEGAFSMQDDLAKLFDRGMIFEQPQPQKQTQAQTSTAAPSNQNTSLGYSASQHYIPVTRPAIIIDEITMPLELQAMLMRKDIDPASLLPAQRSLFENANPEQRERLLLLWSFSSPAHTRVMSNNQDGATSMAREEAKARTSFEQRYQAQHTESAEPYIQTGYGMDDQPAPSYKRSSDPVFESKEWWRHDNSPQQATQAPQEFQYGVFEAMRQYHVPIGDDEMVM